MNMIEKLILECRSLINDRNDKKTEIFIRDLNKIITESSLKKDYLQRFLEIVNMKNKVSIRKLNVDRIGIACTKSPPTEEFPAGEINDVIPEFITTNKEVDAPNRSKLRELLILLYEIQKELEINEFINTHKLR